MLTRNWMPGIWLKRRLENLLSTDAQLTFRLVQNAKLGRKKKTNGNTVCDMSTALRTIRRGNVTGNKWDLD
jgi:hypothetical protein